MPTYQYACTNPEGKHEFEVVQSFSDAPVSECPQCGAAEEVEEELLEESLLPPEDSLLPLLPLDSLAAAGVLALSALRLSVR